MRYLTVLLSIFLPLISCTVDPPPEEPCRSDAFFHFRVDGGSCYHYGGLSYPLGPCEPGPSIVLDSVRIEIEGCANTNGFFRIIFRSQDYCTATPGDLQIDSIMIGVESGLYTEILDGSILAVDCSKTTNSVGRVTTSFHVDFEVTVRDQETMDVVQISDAAVNILF